MADRVVIQPATRETCRAAFEHLYGEAKDVPCRILGFTGSVDGKVIGLGGIAFYANGARVAFCDISDEGRRFPLSLHRSARMLFGQAKKLGVKRVVVLDSAEVHEKTPNWLRHLGFERMGHAPGWIWEGQ
jgi:hypothetical protein